MLKFIAPILACLGTVAAQICPAIQSTGPPEFTITSFSINGSGCPARTATYTLNGAKTAITVTFSDFIAQVGPGIQPRENRKNCQLTFGVHVPRGWTFGIVDIDSRGFYQLDDKVQADQHTYYYFQGSQNQGVCDAPSVVGPQADYYNNCCIFGLGPFCTCGADTILNINTDVRVSNVNNSGGSGVITRDSNDVSFITIFNFSWKPCP